MAKQELSTNRRELFKLGGGAAVVASGMALCGAAEAEATNAALATREAGTEFPKGPITKLYEQFRALRAESCDASCKESELAIAPALNIPPYKFSFEDDDGPLYCRIRRDGSICPLLGGFDDEFATRREIPVTMIEQHSKGQVKSKSNGLRRSWEHASYEFKRHKVAAEEYYQAEARRVMETPEYSAWKDMKKRDADLDEAVKRLDAALAARIQTEDFTSTADALAALEFMIETERLDIDHWPDRTYQRIRGYLIREAA